MKLFKKIYKALLIPTMVDDMFEFKCENVEIMMDEWSDTIEIYTNGTIIASIEIPCEHSSQIFDEINRRNYIVQKDTDGTLCINWYFKINKFDDFQIEMSFENKSNIHLIRMFMNKELIKL